MIDAPFREIFDRLSALEERFDALITTLEEAAAALADDDEEKR